LHSDSAEDATLRIDYSLYTLAIVFFILAAVSFIVISDSNTQIIVVVSAAIWGVIFLIIGYLLKPKPLILPLSASTEAITQEVRAEPMPQKDIEEVKTVIVQPELTPPAAIPEIEIQAPPVDKPVAKLELTQIKGIGEKRAAQLLSNGVTSVVDLANCDATDLAKKLKISPKFVEKWVAAAKKKIK
jgi:predicted flap endonuclease-1-like 5' DNA nuclease